MRISQLTESDMRYPLREKIGKPELLVGCVEEFQKFHKWIEGMPDEISKSRALLGRRKSGKTAFVQRFWSQISLQKKLEILQLMISQKSMARWNIWFH